MIGPQGITRTLSDTPESRGGGMLPTYRTHYPIHIREALHALAESNPTPETYAREKERILAGTRR